MSDGLLANVVVRRGDLHLTLSLEAPAGATIDNATRTLRWMVPAGQSLTEPVQRAPAARHGARPPPGLGLRGYRSLRVVSIAGGIEAAVRLATGVQLPGERRRTSSDGSTAAANTPAADAVLHSLLFVVASS